MDTEPEAPAPSERPREPAPDAAARPPAADPVATPTATEDMPPVAEGPADPAPPAPAPVAPVAAAPVDPAPAPPAPAPPAPAPAPAPVAAAPEAPRDSHPPRRRWLRVVAAIVGVLLGVAVALALLIPGYARGRIVDEARARGIALEFEDVDLGFSHVVLHHVTASLTGAPDFQVTAGSIDVSLTDWQPTAIDASEMEIALFGTDVLTQLGAWKSRYPGALSAPLRAGGARLDWHLARGMAPAATLGAARLSVGAEQGFIDSGKALLFDRDAGPVRVVWTMPADGFTVDIRPLAPPLSAVRAEVRAASSKEAPRLKVVLERTPLAPLQAALGLPAGSEGIQADGELEMPVPSLAKPAPVEGSIRMTVKGYVPPHPRELDGILFGDATKVQSKFLLAADGSGAKLSQVAVEAGALALTGSGDVAREGFDARVTLKLKGTIPCTSLATSAAVAHLGGAWGRLAGGLASGALKGSVAVSLSVDAKASDIKSAKIDKSARLGCKVSVPGLPTIVLR